MRMVSIDFILLYLEMLISSYRLLSDSKQCVAIDKHVSNITYGVPQELSFGFCFYINDLSSPRVKKIPKFGLFFLVIPVFLSRRYIFERMKYFEK